MQGVFAADACPISTKGKLSYLQIRVENQKEIDLYSKMLENLNISVKSSLKYRSIRISNPQNLLNALNHELFKLHNERNSKFLTGFYNRKMSEVPML